MNIISNSNEGVKHAQNTAVGSAAVPAYVSSTGSATACTTSAEYASTGTALFTRAGAYNLYKATYGNIPLNPSSTTGINIWIKTN